MAEKNPYYDPAKPHHTPNGFTNLESDTRKEGDLKRWRKERKEQGFPRPPGKGYDAFIREWCQTPDFGGSEDRLWFLGHACLLLRVDGRYILTDPVLSERASPLSFYGPKRRTPAAVTVASLPKIDYVMISHNHYDHLDKATIRKLVDRFPQVIFMVPLGMKPWMERQGAHYIEEMDWWDALVMDGVSFHAVPARHWSMRTPWDRNRSLWCGWVVKHRNLNFYFSGDSAYSEQFAQIGERLGPFDIAALPIGAYAPRWFMHSHHMDPQQAVQVFGETRCQRAIPIHWGVFELADESLDEPPRELRDAIEAGGLNADKFSPLKIGQHISL
ncbi:MBL fold metallo-hydrolase [Rouxiella chamberiensis]|uniref:MBL fold metallo-hydrolase n=1 Tax=Rouxiella chamberiensis TaxID=1513468 RepID=A0ABY7HU10_9GAMM|nr:MBL fold metallo-hydrolase [Rouxiella chamberiensis]WAT02850.1 MBL fold metallo-hydrolase [Rouxiella chamberiensis]